MIWIVFPPSLNWFFAEQANAAATELQRLGRQVAAVSGNLLDQADLEDPSAVMIISFGETRAAARRAGREAQFLERLVRFKRRILVNYDCIFSKWFREHFAMGHGFFSDVFDVGLARQDIEGPVHGATYHWIPEAFPAERKSALTPWNAGRPLPWAIIGHASKQRAALVTAAVQTLPPNGFIFSPPLMPYDGSYGLDRIQLRSVLEKTVLYIWGSYHRFPYHEALRALDGVEAGAVPAKIDPLHAHRLALPWVYPSLSSLRNAVQESGPRALFEAARDHIVGLGTLGDHLAASLARAGL